jgi:hypothetical protein
MWLGLQWARISRGYECKKAWAWAGYEGTTEGVSCPGYENCDTKQCTYVIPKLTEKWEWAPPVSYWN